ncbi:MAG TPA: hypothetical protein VJ890_13295 [Vineibacter sp.]|nr:hypothetical protein [Vineibacter sp.]
MVLVSGETVSIPYRVDFDEVMSRTPFSTLQLEILDCLQTRHHDGYVRERALRRIIGLNTPWSVPFVVQLASEYVTEILELIETNWGQIDERMLGRFLADNPRFQARVRARVISYWNLHWKRPQRESYVGFKLLARMDQALALTHRSDAPAGET